MADKFWLMTDKGLFHRKKMLYIKCDESMYKFYNFSRGMSCERRAYTAGMPCNTAHYNDLIVLLCQLNLFYYRTKHSIQ